MNNYEVLFWVGEGEVRAVMVEADSFTEGADFCIFELGVETTFLIKTEHLVSIRATNMASLRLRARQEK